MVELVSWLLLVRYYKVTFYLLTDLLALLRVSRIARTALRFS